MEIDRETAKKTEKEEKIQNEQEIRPGREFEEGGQIQAEEEPAEVLGEHETVPKLGKKPQKLNRS